MRTSGGGGWPTMVAAATMGTVMFAAGTAAQAQTKAATPKAAPPGPAAKASPAAKTGVSRTITVTASRPGTYTYWLESTNGAAQPTPLSASGPTTVKLGGDAKTLTVLDETQGIVAQYPTAKMTEGQKVTIAPDDFKAVRAVSVLVTANGGKPVEKASVSVKDASGQSQSRVLTASDNGVARFDNVPLGKISVQASYGADGQKVTQETTVAPVKGGGAFEVPVALAGNVPTLNAPNAEAFSSSGVGTRSTPPLDSTATTRPADPPPNNWIPGVIGMLILGGGIAYAIRRAATSGVTVQDALRKIGVEMPQDGANGTLAAPLKPAPAPLPPLPSLSDLPVGGTASSAVSSFGAASTAPAAGGVMTAVRNAPRLVGLGGSLAGEQFPLEAPLTIGRDDTSGLALTLDKGVSRRHARLEPSGDGWAIIDEGSSNGTFVNGQRVAGTQPLQPGDEIQIGGARFRYEG